VVDVKSLFPNLKRNLFQSDFTTNVDNDNRYKKGIHHPSAKEQEEVKHKNVIRGIGSESDGEIHDRVINGLPLGLYKK
jgi:hypothetical protein